MVNSIVVDDIRYSSVFQGENYLILLDFVSCRAPNGVYSNHEEHEGHEGEKGVLETGLTGLKLRHLGVLVYRDAFYFCLRLRRRVAEPRAKSENVAGSGIVATHASVLPSGLLPYPTIV